MSEKRPPEKGTRLTAVEIHDNILKPAREEMRRPAVSLAMSALASGLVIGFSFLGSAFAAGTAAPRYAHAAAAAAYPLGFIFVVMARSELFTENTLKPVIPLLEKRDRDTFLHLLRMWGVLLLGNLVGAVIFAWTLARTSLVEASLHPHLMELARQSTDGGFGTVLYAAVFAGWLIALLAWLLASTENSITQVAFVWLCTAPIAALHFRHSIAGSVEAFYRAAAGDASWARMLTEFVIPAVIGNAIGGVLLVALLNYGQVVADKEEQRGRWK